ncbi:uncharacterized protein CGFF_01462 [Nakaseomyces glabratus]|nr:hypothetical protein J6894_02100 [Nakaseomyces glabratus]QNG14182.1 uncharacterized protein GWK60_H00935 [Nakaseomyces glabratus]SCV13905.1 uncharacterized protein CGFF_01462 [Nakaseomyces glabratus]SLM12275.1 uncharacterized protein CGFF_01462 [Nakaseomyces glabratus]
MSFFRDNINLPFKNRSNIFQNKLRTVSDATDYNNENSKPEVAASEDSSIVMDEYINKIIETEYSENTVVNDDVGNSFQKPNDELQITEIRIIDDKEQLAPVQDQSHNQTQQELRPNFTQVKESKNENIMQPLITENSNDVLLEAFTNTQKICSNLKSQLLKEQRENERLKKMLNDFEETNQKTGKKINEYKSLFESLNEKLSVLSHQKIQNEKSLKEFVTFQEEQKSKLDKSQIEIESLKSKLNEGKNILDVLKNDLMQKSSEIDFLKKELDEFSGLLSEEKIKSNKINQTIENKNNDLVHYLDKNITNQQNLMDELFKQVSTNNLKKLLQRLDIALTKTQSFVESKSSDILVKIQESYRNNNALELSLENNITNIFNSLSSFIENNANQINDIISSNNKNAIASIDNIDKRFNSFENSLKSENSQLLKLLEKHEQNFSSKLESIDSSLKEYCSEVDVTKKLKDKILALEKYNIKLENDVENNQHSEKRLEQLLASQRNEIESLKVELKSKNETLKNSTADVFKLKEELSVKVAEISRLNEINNLQKVNYESKLGSQSEILKVLIKEKDELKTKIDSIDDDRKRVEDELYKKVANFDKINKQLQSVNVEMVQLAANKLELEEETRNLRTVLKESEKCTTSIERELKVLKQERIQLKAENQDLVSEKLEIEGKLKEMASKCMVNNKEKKKVASADKNPINGYRNDSNSNASNLEEVKKDDLLQKKHQRPSSIIKENTHKQDDEDILDDVFDLSYSNSGSDFESVSSIAFPKLAANSKVKVNSNLEKTIGDKQNGRNTSKKKFLIEDVNGDKNTNFKRRKKT